MLYSYYMKINSKLLAGCLFLGCFVCAQAQVTLVKQDGDKLYLDTSTLNRYVQKGETFKIITSSEMLTNPKTGKQLGQIYHYSKEGKITEIQPLYAVGEIKNAPRFTIGQEAVIEPAPAQEQKTAPAAVQPAPQAQPLSNKKINRPFTLEQTIISLSAADVTGEGKENLITLSDKGLVTVWNTDAQHPAPLFTWQLKNKTGVTLSAADVKNTGRAQIFVTVYNSAKETISTTVLELTDNQLTEKETLPYFTKELGCGKQKQIWVQRPFVLGATPGTAHPLVYDGKRFKTADQRLNTQRNWLTGVNLYPDTADNSLLYTAANGRIRLITTQGKRVESKDLFAAAPNRVKYKQDIIKFYPSVQVYKTEGGPTVAAVENISKLGLLSNTFGSYQNSKIHFMRLEKGRLAQTDSVELDGFVYDTACTADKVLAAEVLPDGTSAVVEIFR